MSEQLNLKEIERKAWRSFFDDGIWDIYLGLLLALMGVLSFLERLDLTEIGRMGIYIGMLVVVMVMRWAGKRFITVPRIGRVRFGAERQKRRKKTALVLFISVIVGLVMFMVTLGVLRGDLSRELPWDLIFPGAWALNMLVVFGLMAYYLDFQRLYFIGFVFALMLPLDFILRETSGLRIAPYMFLGGGLLIAAIGVGYLIRFLGTYPVVRNES